MMMMMMLEPLVLDVLIHGCLIVSVSSFLIMLALPAGNASRGFCSASRAALVRLLSGRRRSGDDGGVPDDEAPSPPPPPPRRRRSRSKSNNSPRHCCERCAASAWPDVVAAVTASLRLEVGGDDDESEEEEGGCGGCAAAAAVEDLLERKEATEQELREAFYVFDRDEDGFVGAGELWNVLRRLGMLPPGSDDGPGCCAAMIAAHDGDGDGRISFRKFRAMMERAA